MKRAKYKRNTLSTRKPKRRRAGRPALPADRLRTAEVGARVNAGELARIEAAAVTTGRGTSAFIRDAALYVARKLSELHDF